MSAEASETGLTQGWETMVFDIVAIKVGEKLLEPFVHNLMICPSMVEFRQEDCATLSRLVAQGRQHICCQIAFDGLSMTLIEFTRPVVRRSLRAHVIASSKGERW